jgi:hypothetical protein
MRIVTHHWSSNRQKGFDVYEKLDRLLAREPFKSYFEFTYIGNMPKGVRFANSTSKGPLYGEELASEIKKNHVYISASRHEGAGMHHIEGMMCGLPVLYIGSGALPEYCSPFGREFTLVNFEEKLFEMLMRYADLRCKVLDCPYTASSMAEKYCELFEELVEKRRESPKAKPGVKAILEYHFYDRLADMFFGIKEILQKVRRRLS